MGRAKTKAARRRLAVTSESNPNRKQISRISQLLNNDQEQQYHWLHMVADPWGPVARMPLILGNGIFDESIFRYHMYGTMVSNSVFTSSSLLGVENWDNVGGDNFMGYTSVGYPLWYTDAAFVGDSSPALAATTATTGLSAAPLSSTASYGGANPTANIQILQTAAAIRARPISTADTTGGLIMIATSSDQIAFPLTGVTYDEVRSYPSEFVNIVERSMANWESEEYIEMSVIPQHRHAFESNAPIAAGSAAVPTAYVGIYCKGMAAGQSVEIEAVSIYQVEETGGDRVYESFTANKINHDSTYGSHYNGSERSGRAVMSPDAATLAAYHLGSQVRPRVVPAKQMGTVHIRNPRSAAAATAVIRHNPGLWDRIKGFASSGVKYVKDNWLQLLLKAVTTAAAVI
jgi:hypothetical protein